MKSYLAKYEEMICCETCKNAGIAESVNEDVPHTEADYQEMTIEEVEDSIYSNESLTCCYCSKKLEGADEVVEQRDLDDESYRYNLELESAWLNNQRR
jgi:hypothetical protein